MNDPLPGTSLQQKIARTALKYVNNSGRYEDGGENIGAGIDCSHFVNLVYNESGIQYPYQQARINKNESASEGLARWKKAGFFEVAESNAAPGDVVYVMNKRHVGIVWDPKDKTFIHASNDCSENYGGKAVGADVWSKYPRQAAPYSYTFLRYKDIN